jgi:hypothetical protein
MVLNIARLHGEREFSGPFIALMAAWRQKFIPIRLRDAFRKGRRAT